MPRFISKFSRLVAGEVDCPNCGRWMTSAQRKEHALMKNRTWICPACDAVLRYRMTARLRAVVGTLCLISVLPFLSFMFLNSFGIAMRIAASQFEWLIWTPLSLMAGYVALFLLTSCYFAASDGAASRVVFRPGVCRNCRFDLRGVNHERCPECGTACQDVVKAWQGWAARQAIAVRRRNERRHATATIEATYQILE